MLGRYLTWFVSSKKTRNYLKYLEKSQQFKQDELEKIQFKKLYALLNYAYRNVPFYQRIYKEHGVKPNDLRRLDDIRKFPIICKHDLRKAFPKECVGKTYTSKDLVYRKTSGSTGTPFSLFVGKDKMYVREASKLRFDRWAGLNQGEKYALFWFPPNEAKLISKIHQRVRNMLLSQLSIGMRYVDEHKLMLEIERIRKFRPKIFKGYPQFLYIFAKYVSENNIEGIKPSAIISEGFLLISTVRDYIEEVFGCKVFNHYGTVEITSVAQECSEHVGLHINAENRLVEILTHEDVALSGELGEIVITDLENYAMPFIRYEMGDMAAPTDENCPCGRGLPLMKNIQGRILDFIVYKDRMVFPDIRIFFLPEFRKSIHDFQIVQNSLEEIKINLVADHGLNTDLIISKFKKSFPDIEIKVDLVSSIPTTPSGKHRYVYSAITSKLMENYYENSK